MTELVFSNKLAVNPNEYRFLEVDEALLNQLIESDGEICIKGAENDEAVLCTNKETFAIKQVETSNALLLVDTDPGANRTASEEPVEIKAVIKANLELQKIRPNLDPLKDLLRQELFDLEQDEDAEHGHNRSTETLFNKLQASKAELLAGLKRLEAVQHRGQWWLLHPRTEEVILREILNIRLQFSWPVTALPSETLLSHFSADIPRHIAEHTLQVFTTGEGDTRALNVTRVTQFFARHILRQKKGNTMKVNDLLQEWRHVLESLDLIVEPRMEDLKGIVLTEEQGAEAKVRLFDAQELPSNTKLRFKELFKCRAKWTLDEISPYLSEILSPGEKEESLLMHHTRQSTVQGVKYYSARE